ncbi:MAG: hypothetical protein ACE5G3_02900 [Gammaproteobacteria bacterium]
MTGLKSGPARWHGGAMETVYFVIVAIVLYFGSDWILRRMEVAAGRRFEYRSFIFFAILLALALISFALIRNYAGNPL